MSNTIPSRRRGSSASIGMAGEEDCDCIGAAAEVGASVETKEREKGLAFDRKRGIERLGTNAAWKLTMAQSREK